MDDTTLGGYQQVHGRPPAFGAADGQAYSVATFADEGATCLIVSSTSCNAGESPQMFSSP